MACSICMMRDVSIHVPVEESSSRRGIVRYGSTCGEFVPAAQGHETYCSTDFGCLATNTWPTTNKGATFSNTRFPDARTFSPPLLVRRRCRAHSRAGSSTGTRLPSPRLSFVLLPLPRAACAPRGRLPCRHPPVFAPPLLFPRRCGTLFTPPPSIDPRLAPPSTW